MKTRIDYLINEHNEFEKKLNDEISKLYEEEWKILKEYIIKMQKEISELPISEHTIELYTPKFYDLFTTPIHFEENK